MYTVLTVWLVALVSTATLLAALVLVQGLLRQLLHLASSVRRAHRVSSTPAAPRPLVPTAG